ncbi:hypothetical protein M405DRAFT_284376 [Rhizopogon salebrosus TDB-379]|nr:hypothetical protein M405DRAFT_284376 [Rhizopogon salebrosus TDB-379]
MRCWRFVDSICRRRHVMSNPGSFKTLEAFRCHSIISESVTSATECDTLPAPRFASIAIPDQDRIYLFHLPKSFDCMPPLRFRPQPSTSQYRRLSCHPLQPLRMADEDANLKVQQFIDALPVKSAGLSMLSLSKNEKLSMPSVTSPRHRTPGENLFSKDSSPCAVSLSSPCS